MRNALFLIALAIGLLAVATYAIEGPREMNDLEVFHRAGERFNEGAPLYRASDGHFEWKYLPAAALAFAPLALLPLPVAKVLWIAVSATALALSFVLAVWLFGEDEAGKPRVPRWAPIVAFAVLARSMERELAHGQVNAVVLVFVLAAFLALAKKRDAAAGVFLVLAIVLKPHWLLAFPYLLAARRWRAATTLAAGFIVALAAPTLRYGASGTLDLHVAMRARLAASTARLLTYPTNVSLAGAIAKATGIHASAAVPVALALIALLFVVFALHVWRERAHPARDLAFLAPLALLASPQAWDYTVVTALPVIGVLAFVRDPRARVVTIVLASIVALDFMALLGRGTSYLAIMRLSPNTWFLVWCVAVALSAVLALQRTRVNRTTSPSAS